MSRSLAKQVNTEKAEGPKRAQSGRKFRQFFGGVKWLARVLPLLQELLRIVWDAGRAIFGVRVVLRAAGKAKL